MTNHTSAEAAMAQLAAGCSSFPGLTETPVTVQCIGHRMFLDARRVSHELLAGLVAHFYTQPEKPMVVIVFADMSGLDWGEANSCNEAVARAGGILVDLRQEDLTSAIRKWSGEGRTRPAPPIQSDLPRRTGPADWSPYRSAFLSEAEFRELQSAIRDHREDGSVIS